MKVKLVRQGVIIDLSGNIRVHIIYYAEVDIIHVGATNCTSPDGRKSHFLAAINDPNKNTSIKNTSINGGKSVTRKM